MGFMVCWWNKQGLSLFELGEWVMRYDSKSSNNWGSIHRQL